MDCGAEGEGPRELIPIVLGFERLGELISHLHPQRLQEAAKAAKELPTLRPWPQGQGDLSHCEDPEGLVTKYVEQSLVWAAMIVSRCRSMFVLAHLKQKRMGAVNLYLSLSRARQHRMARTWQRWRRSACLMQRSVAQRRLRESSPIQPTSGSATWRDLRHLATKAQKKQEQLQLWSQGVARTLRLKLLHAQLPGLQSLCRCTASLLSWDEDETPAAQPLQLLAAASGARHLNAMWRPREPHHKIRVCLSLIQQPVRYSKSENCPAHDQTASCINWPGSRFSQCRSKDGSDNKQRIHGNDRVSRLLHLDGRVFVQRSVFFLTT